MATEAHADAIASTVLEEFGKLAPKRKPAVRDNGLREWVPLSGIVVKGILLADRGHVDKFLWDADCPS
jgi:tRNA-specific adenosine deaminase 1